MYYFVARISQSRRHVTVVVVRRDQGGIDTVCTCTKGFESECGLRVLLALCSSLNAHRTIRANLPGAVRCDAAIRAEIDSIFVEEFGVWDTSEVRR